MNKIAVIVVVTLLAIDVRAATSGDDAKPPEPVAPSRAPAPRGDPFVSLPERWIDEIVGPQLRAREQDPLKYLTADMSNIQSDLSQCKTDAPVQTKERQVVARLDVLIKELEKSCKSGNGGANPNPTKPMTDSVIAKGPGGSGPLHDAKDGIKQWGTLPPKQREQILQSKTEGFPAGYETILQSYYNHLAQEKAPGDDGTPPAPAPAPTKAP